MCCKKIGVSQIIPLLIYFCTVQIGYSQSNSKHEQINLSEYLSYLEETKGFSGEILVAKGTEILFNEAIGKASIELDIDMQLGHKFHIASITKTFTGTLISMAITEGLLSKQDRLVSFINGLPDRFSSITIHQLLTHTSGLPHNEAISGYWQTKSRLEFSSEQMIQELSTLELLFAPSEKFSYSSPGYYLLSIILEEVYHKPFKEILKEKILDRLDIKDTGSVHTLQILSNMVSGYHLLPNDSLVKAPYRNYSLVKGAGDLYSTAKDLWNWHKSFTNHTFLSKDQHRLIFESGETYGYGWYIDQSDHLKYYHGGGTWGYSSYNAYYPKERLSIIVLSNISTLPMTQIGEQLEGIVFGESKIETKTIQERPSSLPANKYIGSYSSETSNMILSIRLQDGVLYAQLQGNPPFKLTPTGGNEFLGKQIDIKLNFQVTNSQIEGLEAERMGRKFKFKKQ